MTATGTVSALENVLYEKKGAIAYVTVNRPKVLNALDQKTVAELRAVFEEARDDAEVWGVIGHAGIEAPYFIAARCISSDNDRR